MNNLQDMLSPEGWTKLDREVHDAIIQSMKRKDKKMKIIDETKPRKQKQYNRGQCFKLEDIYTNDLDDVLMIAQAMHGKYFFVSLKDAIAGKMYGWGNGNPADSISDLLDQISSQISSEERLVPIKTKLIIKKF